MDFEFDVKDIIERVVSLKNFYEIKNKGRKLHVKRSSGKRKWFRPFEMELPKKVNISPEVVGLFVGEGFADKGTIVFANSNGEVISRMLTFFNQFGTKLRFYLEISTGGISRDFIENAKKFWESKYQIELSKVRLRNEFFNTTKYGTLHICKSNPILYMILREIIDICKLRVEEDKNLSLKYLKGIFAAEGNVNVKKDTKCVYMVWISAKKKEERNHYKRCLNNLGIYISCKDMPTISKTEGIAKGWTTNKGRAGAVLISKWDNFVKILNMGLLDLHEDKKHKFHEFFNNNKFTKQFLSFEHFLNKDFTMKEAQCFFGFKGRNVDRLLTLYKKQYIDRTFVNNKYVYRLNDNYRLVYNKIKGSP